MKPSSEAIIYLGDLRKCTQSDWHRSYQTFGFESHLDENKKPFGKIQAFNDDTLEGGRTLKLRLKNDLAIVLLPLAGALNYTRSTGLAGIVETGEMHFILLYENAELQVTNPFETELINFFHIWLTVDEKYNRADPAARFEFDLEQSKNQLMSFVLSENDSPVSFSIGKFSGRKEGAIHLKNPHNDVFAFVIEGAFEVQERLLQQRDGLAVWSSNKVEFEALSNDAIILLIE